jgi:hypothetical protein
MISNGMMLMIEAAICTSYAVRPTGPTIDRMTRGKVKFSEDLRMIKGHKKEFQELMKKIKPRLTSPGVMIGKMTRQ